MESHVLSTALLLNEIYQPTKFLVDTTCNFRVPGQSSKGLNKQ